MNFVEEGSIVRRIWGKADTVLFIFAGAAAEFALNKAVDWLYYTGKLPADPLGRLFSTVAYSRRIIFSEQNEALQAIDKITAIHQHVEQSRETTIPDWAYRDVLFMLIDLSINAYQVLERPLSALEKAQTFMVFKRVGVRMQLKNLPSTYAEYVQARQQHLQRNLQYSEFTADLYRQYRKHLGPVRFELLKQVQLMITPLQVRQQLNMGRATWLIPVLWAYKVLKQLKIYAPLRNALLPRQYKQQIKNLDHTP